MNLVTGEAAGDRSDEVGTVAVEAAFSSVQFSCVADLPSVVMSEALD